MLEYDGSAWHEDCFTCYGCEKPIGAEAFIPDKGNYYCVPCYEGRFAPQCSHCKKVKRASSLFLLRLFVGKRGRIWNLATQTLARVTVLSG